MGDSDQAIRDYKKALEIEPNNRVIQSSLSSALLDSGRLHEVLEGEIYLHTYIYFYFENAPYLIHSNG